MFSKPSSLKVSDSSLILQKEHIEYKYMCVGGIRFERNLPGVQSLFVKARGFLTVSLQR